MKSLCFIWVLALAMSVPTAAQPNISPSPESWAGCYELSAAPADEKLEIWGKLPPRFQLVANLPGEPYGEKWFQIKVPKTDDHWLVSVWTPQNDSEISVNFGTGFVGYQLKIRKSDAVFTGTVKPYSDEFAPHKSFAIAIKRVACQSEPARTNPKQRK